MKHLGFGKMEIAVYEIITSLDKEALLQMLYFHMAIGVKNKSLVMLIYLLLLL
jgi:hypothetical protein